MNEKKKKKLFINKYIVHISLGLFGTSLNGAQTLVPSHNLLAENIIKCFFKRMCSTLNCNDLQSSAVQCISVPCAGGFSSDLYRGSLKHI